MSGPRPSTDPRVLPERAFQNQVISAALLAGFDLVYHAPAGGKAGRVDREQRGAGFPDLVLVHGGDRRLLFVELKTDRGRLRPTQMLWIAALERIAEATPHVEVYVWKPADWDDLWPILRDGPR